MKLVGFAGAKGSGKTTAARYLVRHGAVIKSFAAPLKNFLFEFMNFEHEQLHTLEGKETIDPRYGVTPRRVMEAFATDFIRKAVPNFWEVKMRETLSHDHEFVVVDDIRFDSESALIRELGGVVVHIEDRGLNLKWRNNWFLKWLLPKSERGIKVLSQDIVISNAGTITSFQVSLQRFIPK